MSNYDTETPEVLDALKESLDGVKMGTPVEQIIATGRARQHRRRLAGAATAVVAAAGVTVGVVTFPNPSAAPPAASDSITDSALHIQTVGYTVDRSANGTVEVTWDKQRYFEDREGLAAALREAGFPVLIKVGEFCKGPNDDGTLNPSGTGPGVDRVVQRKSEADGKVTFVFSPSAMPAGKQLFIGYLSQAQLAVTHGSPGSVERLISTGVPLTCTTVAPPAHRGKGDGESANKKPLTRTEHR
jgi:hypothetical protein